MLENPSLTHTILPWTEHLAIATLEGGEDPVKNVLVFEAGTDEVGFYVNGENCKQPTALRSPG